MKDFKDKVVIVTGASSGIGEAMAREFAAQGARVVMGARSVQKLQLIAGDIRSRGGQAAYCGVDVTNVDECRGLIDTAVREFGGVDVLVCNAGLSMRAIFDDVNPGQAIITCSPFLRFSMRSVSRNPVMAYFEAE